MASLSVAGANNLRARLALPLLAIFLACHIPLAQASDALDQWRTEAVRIRKLADNDAPKAYEGAKHQKAALPTTAPAADQARALNNLARIETYLGLTDAADSNAQKARDLAEQGGDIIGQVEANLSIALNGVNQSRLEAAAMAANRAMALSGQLHDRPELVAEAMLRSLIASRRSGQFENSITLALQNMDIARNSGNALALVYAHQGLALSYEQSNREDEAQAHYAQMRDQARAAGSRLFEAQAIIGLAAIANRLRDVRRAEALYIESIATLRAVGAPFSISAGLWGLANIYSSEKRYAEAQPLLAESIAINERYNNKIGLWWQLSGRGASHEAQGHLVAARADAERAYALAKEIRHPIYIANSAQRMAVFLSSDDDYQGAYRYSREANEMLARQASEKATNHMVDLAQRYQTESRQRQAEEQARREKQISLERRWLWTLLVASVALLSVSAYFLHRLRRAHQQQAGLNIQLQQSRNKLQATIDAIPDLLFEVDLQGRFIDCHTSRHELLVVPPEDLIGKTVTETLPADAAETCFAALREAHDVGASFGRSYTLDLPHGKFWFELSVARKIMPDGQEPSFIALSRNITERKYAELALQDERRVFIGGPTMAFKWRAVEGWPAEYISPNITDHLGYSPEDFTSGRVPFASIVHPDDLARVAGEVAMHSAAGVQNFEQEYRIARADGEYRWIYDFTVVVRDAAGTITHYHGHVIDITERKRHEDKLALLNYALDNIEEAVFLYSGEEHFSYVNAYAARYLGYSREELLGMGVLDIDPNIQKEQLLAHWRDIQDCGSMSLQSSHKTKCGRVFPVDVMSNFFESGGKGYSLALCRDITERQRMETLIAAREREFRTLTENSPDNIARYDRECRILYVNPALKATLGGRPPSDYLGKTPHEAFGEFYGEFQSRLAGVIETGRADTIDLTFPDTGSGVRHHHVRIVAERDEEGKTVGALAIGRDVTELVLKERQIEESRDLLRELSAYRDTAREEERKRIAREVHDELGQMLTAQRLDIATLKYQFGEKLPRLSENLDHLLKVTDQTILVVRGIATALRPAALDMGIKPSLEWLVAEFCSRTDVDCRLYFDNADAPLDEQQSIAVFRIVQESLTNVARYAEARQVEIALERGYDRYLLSIRDDGKGFDPALVRARSFGLVGIRERALMLGGELHVISAPGRGAAIQIHFPCHPTERSAP